MNNYFQTNLVIFLIGARENINNNLWQQKRQLSFVIIKIFHQHASIRA